MATQQTRINALLDQLDGLGAKRTGMPIDADDWNALIDTVRGTLEVAAAQDVATSGALDVRYTPVDHEHLAQVTTDWLAAELRSRRRRRRQPERDGDDRRRAARIAGGPADRGDGAGAQRARGPTGRIDRSITADVDRTNDVADLRTQVGTVDTLRGTVAGLEDQLASRPARSRTSTACGGR